MCLPYTELLPWANAHTICTRRNLAHFSASQSSVRSTARILKSATPSPEPGAYAYCSARGTIKLFSAAINLFSAEVVGWTSKSW